MNLNKKRSSPIYNYQLFFHQYAITPSPNFKIISKQPCQLNYFDNYFNKNPRNPNLSKFKYTINIVKQNKIKKLFLINNKIKKIKYNTSINRKTALYKTQTNQPFVNYYNINFNIKYQKIFNNFFYNLFKKKIIFINFNYFIKTKITKLNLIVRKVLLKHFFLKKTVLTYKIIKILYASVVYKDSSLLILIIRNMFENAHYSKHRIYFHFWSYLIKSFLSNSLKKLNIFGLKLEFHGKLGVGGNSKKRSFYYDIGRCSNSSKIFKVDISNSYFKTATGVVGFCYSIYY